MQYIYRGEFSKGLDSIVSMGVTFSGREPSEVRDAAAANWFDGHPDYVRVPEEPAAEGQKRRLGMPLALVGIPPKKPAPKKKAPAKKPAKAKAKK